MTKLLLTLESFENVKAGVEIFSMHLKTAFKDLKIINAETVGFENKSKLISPFKDVLKAKVICDYVNRNFKLLKPEMIFVNGLCGWALSKEINVPVVCILHGGYASYADAAMKFGPDYLRTKYIYSYFEALSAKRATCRISNSEFTRRNMAEYCNMDSSVVYNGIDTGVFKPFQKKSARKELKLDLNKKIALFVGRPDYAKGYDIIEKLAMENKDLQFIAVLYPCIESKIANLKTVGPLSSKELRKYYCAADIVVNPSRFEGFGYVALEALSCNTPVITHNTGIAKEVDVKGLIKISKASQKLFSYKLKINFGKKIKAHTFVNKHFSEKLFCKNYKKLVSEIINNSRS